MFATDSSSSAPFGVSADEPCVESGEKPTLGGAGTSSVEFERVYSDHFAFVWRSVRGLGVEAANVDDVTQEVFLVVHRRLHTLQDARALKSWLFGIARRVTKDHRRATGRRGKTVELDVERAETRGTDPERQHSERQLMETVARYADSLDDERRALFFLALVEGIPVADAAEMLGSNANTTYSRVRAMRRELSEVLGLSVGKGDAHGTA
jgi:RNA polymerase sigma-70 factor, ECF subfamily